MEHLERDRVVRLALRASIFFNGIGAIAFAFPASVGALMGLPPEVPAIYRFTVPLFVLLFSAIYAWLASQETINRPMVAFSGVGKGLFFVLAFVLWLAGEASILTVAGASGDLLLAIVFLRWATGAAN